jgi:hypothetical protein
VTVNAALKLPLLIALAPAILFAGTFGVPFTPLTEVPTVTQTRELPAMNAYAVKQLPVYSETLTGARMEPINFIYLGTQDKIEDTFNRAGWFKADPSTPGNTLKARRPLREA